MKYDAEAVRALATHAGFHSLLMLVDKLHGDLVRQLQEVKKLPDLLRIQGALQTCTWLRNEFRRRVETPRTGAPTDDDPAEEFLREFRKQVIVVGNSHKE
jgi:hypothetical protein